MGAPTGAFPFRENYLPYNDHPSTIRSPMYQFFMVCAVIVVIVVMIKMLKRL